MQNLLAFITWDVDPVAFSLFGLDVRWYGVLYAIAFFVGGLLLTAQYKRLGRTHQLKDVDRLTISAILAVIIGARVGHYLFYHTEELINNPLVLFDIRGGGMASHGSFIAIVIAIWLYVRKRPDQPYLWIADRIAVAISFGSILIRLGNLMNSEIVGHVTQQPWGFIFVRSGENVDLNGDGFVDVVARHPVVLYEAIAYFFLFLFMMWLFFRRRPQVGNGFYAGIYLVLIFIARFSLETFKTEQVESELILGLPLLDYLTMGQILSVPGVLLGVVFLWISLKRPTGPPTSMLPDGSPPPLPPSAQPKPEEAKA